MHAWWRRLVLDETGSVEMLDWAFVATILVLAAVTALATTRQTSLEQHAPPPAARAVR